MKRLAYLLATFPALTETFVVGEILELRRRGVPIELFALRQPRETVDHRDAEALRPETTYARGLGDPRLLAAHLRMLARRPGRYLRTLGLVVRGTWRNPVLLLKSLALFAKAVDLAEIMTARGIEHVHAHWATYPTTCALVVSGLTGRPFSFTAHAWDISLVRTFLPEKIAHARFVVTCTRENQSVLAGLAPGAHAAKVHLNYHGVSLERFAPPAERRRAERPRILACGSLFERKGLADLVRACALLARAGVAFDCVIVGEGPQRPKLQALIAEGGLGERVQLVGAMAPTEVIRQYERADVFVLPCLARSVDVIDEEADVVKSLECWFEGKGSVIKDGIPNVLMEAMAMGVPVVSTPTAGIPELVIDDVNGVLVPPRNPAALAAAIRRLLGDEDLRRRLALRASEDVRARFDRRVTANELADIFTSHLNGHRPARSEPAGAQA